MKSRPMTGGQLDRSLAKLRAETLKRQIITLTRVTEEDQHDKWWLRTPRIRPGDKQLYPGETRRCQIRAREER